MSESRITRITRFSGEEWFCNGKWCGPQTNSLWYKDICQRQGIDIMLRRFREYLRREEEIRAKAKDEVYDEVYKEVTAWDRRRRDAEARGIEFKEPLPIQPRENSQNNSDR